jgi:hypothetical protein
MRPLVILIVVLLAPAAHAEDSALVALRLTLLPMRAQPHAHEAARGATARMTVAKHRLRRWVETRLSGFPQDGDEAAFVRRMNDELARARLFCEADGAVVEESCDKASSERLASNLGYLHPLKAMRRGRGVLVVETGFAILCGNDASAYAYEWRSGRWRRFWQSERRPGAAGRYAPQSLNDVLVANLAGEAAGDRLVLTLGRQEWCSSFWQRVYYRLWRTHSGGRRRTARLLLERAETAYLSDVDGPLRGRLEPTGAWIEFMTDSIDGDVNFRGAVRHYRIVDDGVTLVEPIALRPREFIEEWIAHPWPASARWSQPASPPALRRRHRALHGKRVSGSFLGPTLRCDPATHWQVGFRFERRGRSDSPTYFIVQWRPAYGFSVVDVLDHPRADCRGEDAHVDDFRRLIPVAPGR